MLDKSAMDGFYFKMYYSVDMLDTHISLLNLIFKTLKSTLDVRSS